jgi:hypothetical protein
MKGRNLMQLKEIKEKIRELFEKVKQQLGKKGTPGTLPVMKVGVNQKSVRILWGLLIVSVCFGIYKNFTAVNVHTIHEKEVVQEKLVDTNAIQNFVRNFAETYYTWNNDKTAIEKRASAIGDYLTDDLKALDAETIRSDIPTSSTVNEVQVWNVKQKSEQNYDVVYLVKQQLVEGESKSTCKNFYEVTVYQDGAGGLVITKNPTICAAVAKSSYKPESTSTDGTVNAAETQEITDFLQTFFKLYPTVSEKELAYYVKDGAMKPVGNGNYVFSELNNPIFTKKGSQVHVTVTVKYLDQVTKATQISQFDLMLQKDSNWMIVKEN